MEDSSPSPVPRTPEEPSEDDVLAAMTPCEPYTASELRDIFDDASRWTIQRRLDSLQEAGRVRKKKHAENRVSWWIEAEPDAAEEAKAGAQDDTLSCPDCGRSFDSFDDLREHIEATDPDH